MDNDEFKNKLSKICKWYIPIVNEGRGCSGALRKPKPESKSNPSLGPVIEQMYPMLKPCEWCGNIVDQKTNHTRRITEPDKRGVAVRCEPYWEHSCHTCKKIWDPSTGQVKAKKTSEYYQKQKLLKEAQAEENKKRWWNDPEVYTVSDNDKLGQKKA